MDEQLRTNPDDIVSFMRAGRLDTKRVAMAIYLGDQRATATAVAAWAPPDEGPPSRSETLIAYADLSPQQLVWLACACVETVLQSNNRAVPVTSLATTKEWCQGRASLQDLTRATNEAALDGWGDGPINFGFVVSLVSKAAKTIESGSNPAMDAGLRPANMAAWQAVREATSALSQLGDTDPEARVAEAMSAALLDPDCPVWIGGSPE